MSVSMVGLDHPIYNKHFVQNFSFHLLRSHVVILLLNILNTSLQKESGILHLESCSSFSSSMQRSSSYITASLPACGYPAFVLSEYAFKMFKSDTFLTLPDNQPQQKSTFILKFLKMHKLNELLFFNPWEGLAFSCT